MQVSCVSIRPCCHHPCCYLCFIIAHTALHTVAKHVDGGHLLARGSLSSACAVKSGRQRLARSDRTVGSRSPRSAIAAATSSLPLSSLGAGVGGGSLSAAILVLASHLVGQPQSHTLALPPVAPVQLSYLSETDHICSGRSWLFWLLCGIAIGQLIGPVVDILWLLRRRWDWYVEEEARVVRAQLSRPSYLPRTRYSP